MSPLAQKLYRRLRKHLIAGKPSITYGQLATAIDIHPRSPALHAALGEVTNACRHSSLPVLPAIVWKSGSNRPSTGYYKAAHPRAHTEEAQLSAWQREYDKVIESAKDFPDTLAE